MFFSLSTIPVKSSPPETLNNIRTDKIITFLILLIWILLISFAIISITRPQWLIDMSASEKEEEAMGLKRYGDRYLDKKDYKNAILHYNAALIKQPDLYPALGNLAILYSQTGEYNKAISILKKMIELKPEESYIAEKNLADIYEVNKIYDQAIKYYTLAAEKAPYPSHLYSKLGNLYCKTDQCAKAVEAFRNAISSRSDIKLHYQGMLERDYFRISDRPDVQEVISQLLEKGIAEEDMDRFDLNTFNKEVIRDKEYAIAFNNLGWAYQSIGQYDNALMSYNNAIKLNPRYLQAVNNREALLKLMEAEKQEKS
jgi:tetratricopeptide (TPR) repeat protein